MVKHIYMFGHGFKHLLSKHTDYQHKHKHGGSVSNVDCSKSVGLGAKSQVSKRNIKPLKFRL